MKIILWLTIFMVIVSMFLTLFKLIGQGQISYLPILGGLFAIGYGISAVIDKKFKD